MTLSEQRHKAIDIALKVLTAGDRRLPLDVSDEQLLRRAAGRPPYFDPVVAARNALRFAILREGFFAESVMPEES